MAHVASKRSFDEVSDLQSYHALLPDIAKDITALCAAGDRARKEAGKPRRATVLDGNAPAHTSVQDYLVRLCKYSHCSPHTWPVMHVYIARLRDARRASGDADLNSHNVHRIVLCCFVLAAKLRDDVYFANKFYAQVGGVTTRDLNQMESALLVALDWRTHVEMSELLRRGLLSPTEEAAARALRKSSAVPALCGAAERSPAVDDLGGCGFAAVAAVAA